MTKSMPAVLIIGAGPVGMALACELLQQKVDVRIIDSLPDQSTVCGPATIKHIEPYDYTWSFDKNGGFQEKLVHFYDYYLDIYDNTQTCPDEFTHDSLITVTVNNWNFTTNVGNFKNKEQMYIYDNETKLATIYTIIELREKEMKLETSIVNPNDNTVYLKQYTLKSL